MTYVNIKFIEKIRDLSEEAYSRVKLNRNCIVEESIHHEDLDAVIDACDFWSSLNTKAKEWLSENQNDI